MKLLLRITVCISLIFQFKVITTFGPRKPQRHSSYANSSIASDIEEYNSLGNRAECSTTHVLENKTSPPIPHKVCLETSFTSLQSPLDAHGNDSSKASSLTGSIFGKSQISSILQYDISSMIEDSSVIRSISGPSEATTVLLVSDYARSGKNVNFDVNQPTSISAVHVYPALSVSPRLVPKSILNKQSTPSPKSIYTKVSTINQNKRPSNLNTKSKTKSLDLIHDDWFGLAPLASPESLSEISSISSRTSNVISLARSIDKCLQNISITDVEESIQIDESQLQTPKVLRRAPKITGNLSTCADDWLSVDSYKRMGKIFVTGHFVPSNNSNSDSSDLSYETASSLSRNCITTNELDLRYLEQQSKSADNLDNNSTQLVDNFKQTNSESRMFNESQLSCFACSTQVQSKRVLLNDSFCLNNAIASNATNSSSGDTYYSAMSSLNNFESSNSNSSQLQSTNYIPEECSTINIETGLLESHFPVFTFNDDQLSLLQSSSTSTDNPKTKNAKVNGKRINLIQNSKINSTKKRNNSNDFFSKNESLPLLANLSEKSSPTNYVKRKRHIYPMNTSISLNDRPTSLKPSQIVKGESHV